VKKQILKLFVVLALTQFVFAQEIMVNCETDNVIEALPTPNADNIKIVDKIIFDCGNTLMLQDNIVLYIWKVEGFGRIIRGGKGGAPTINGVDRFEGDANPMIVLIGCEGAYNDLQVFENIDVVYVTNNCEN
tara:strand:- start:588 stop:983 length:396 start_codon:yes stop_codon:yes gene_type:complete